MLCLIKVELSLRKALWLTLKYISSRYIFLYTDLIIPLYAFITVVIPVLCDFPVAFDVTAAANVEPMHDKLAPTALEPLWVAVDRYLTRYLITNKQHLTRKQKPNNGNIVCNLPRQWEPVASFYSGVFLQRPLPPAVQLIPKY